MSVLPALLPLFHPTVATLRAAGCIFAEDEATLLIASAQTSAHLAAMVDRRVSGLPLEHILGWADFCGQRIAVDAGVFVPRRRTELLVREGAALARLAPPRAVVLDLCCGSGAVGAALAASVVGVELHAVDIDPAAVQCARKNVSDTRGQVYQGDLYRPLPRWLRARVCVLLANAPYVPTESIALLPAEARMHESRTALDGGADGLDVQRGVAAGATAWLASGGHLLIETSESQAPQTLDIVAATGMTARLVRSRALGATVVIGTNC